MNHQQLVPVQFPIPNLQADQLPPPDWDAVGDALKTLGQQAHRMAQVVRIYSGTFSFSG